MKPPRPSAPPDPLDNADAALARTRSRVAELAEADDWDEITARHEITVNVNATGAGSQPDLGRVEQTGQHPALPADVIPRVPTNGSHAGLLGLLATFATTAAAIAHALGWI
jgi:hypothetical protein